MKKIFYIVGYDTPEFDYENRTFFVSAKNKADYILLSLTKNGFDVEIISPTSTKNSRGWYKSRNTKISDSTKLNVGPTFGGKGKLVKIGQRLLTWIWLLVYFICNVKRDDEVILYHGTCVIPILILKKIKKFSLILEVEEIYQDLMEYSNYKKKLEYSLFSIADKYIFSNEILNERLNYNKKPYCVVYGTYQVEYDRKSKFVDNKIHLVYSGIINKEKGSGLSVEIAQYLPENYHVHIIGYGSLDDVAFLKESISVIKKKSICEITYGGLLLGEDYISFLQKCDFGLCTQISDKKYNNASFPSKISSYLANGLRVISAKAQVIEKSRFGNILFFYEEPNPQSIAQLILNIDLSEKYDSKTLLKELDSSFALELKNVLGCV